MTAEPDAPDDAPDWADEAEQRLLDAALALAPERGWNAELPGRAGASAGLSPGEVELLIPGGARDLAALLSRRHDRAAMTALAPLDPAGMKIRRRISAGVEARIEAAMADEAALRRWALYLGRPDLLPLALRLAWESADILWRWAGDTAVDENHYSKRAILSAILISTLAVRLASGRDMARAHLAARIENVMAFERWKAGFKPADVLREAAEALGRLRYGRV
jgi:ubiquinone biosynthesis protein COQ9